MEKNQIICSVQSTWLACFILMANSGPDKSYPLIYHQVIHVNNLQCAGHVAGVLQPDGDSGPLHGHPQHRHQGLHPGQHTQGMSQLRKI